jgi:hypothetical protein
LRECIKKTRTRADHTVAFISNVRSCSPQLLNEHHQTSNQRRVAVNQKETQQLQSQDNACTSLRSQQGHPFLAFFLLLFAFFALAFVAGFGAADGAGAGATPGVVVGVVVAGAIPNPDIV